MYQVEVRFQYRAFDGIKWTKWTKVMFTNTVETEQEAKILMKHCKEDTKECDKQTKLKHEYQIVKI